mmetsp:Transcript_107609/g.303031  ORF Transcript_107609/g.303031 Transcript_107609/m.303031 type:complete len:248 (-) Transcript_107609:208-951(-)
MQAAHTLAHVILGHVLHLRRLRRLWHLEGLLPMILIWALGAIQRQREARADLLELHARHLGARLLVLHTEAAQRDRGIRVGTNTGGHMGRVESGYNDDVVQTLQQNLFGLGATEEVQKQALGSLKLLVRLEGGALEDDEGLGAGDGLPAARVEAGQWLEVSHAILQHVEEPAVEKAPEYNSEWALLGGRAESKQGAVRLGAERLQFRCVLEWMLWMALHEERGQGRPKLVEVAQEDLHVEGALVPAQ